MLFCCVIFMSKKLFKDFSDRIARCQSPSELLLISHEVQDSSELSVQHKVALAFSCIFAAKWFDKKGICYDQNSSLECPDQE